MRGQEMKAAVRRAIDARADDITGLARQIAAQPEVGFKERRTAQRVADKLTALGLAVQTGLALTGVKAILDGGAGVGPTVGLLGEMDALVVWEHPEHDPHTGAVHACC